jgi:hypothetical protein
MMKFSMIVSLAISIIARLSPIAVANENSYSLREGDIVFSSSPAGQGRAIIDATKSPYTHCGVVLQANGKLMVLEAIEPVSLTTLENFASRSTEGSFSARRLKVPLTAEADQRARKWGMSQLGLHYDAQFRWDDSRMYCSELVWKFFEHAGVSLCAPRHFRDYHLDEPSVKKFIVERYGRIEQFPLNEKVVAPSDIAASLLLIEPPRMKG